jgi:hypothetical protein
MSIPKAVIDVAWKRRAKMVDRLGFKSSSIRGWASMEACTAPARSSHGFYQSVS